VANGVVYVQVPYAVFALDAGTGGLLWSYGYNEQNFTSAGYSSPAVANGVVYIGTADGNVYAFNASTGAELWSFDDGILNSIISSPAVANGVVYVGAGYGYLYALNASTGARLWSDTTDGYVGSSPAVANGVVYIGSDFDSVYALNASTGARLRSYAIGDETVFTSAAIVDGVVYIRGRNQSGNSTVYAFGLGPGNADLLLRIQPAPTTVHQGDLLTYAFPVWNLGPGNAVHEVLNTQVPAGTTLDYIRISGTPGLGTCTAPPYQGTGQIVCHENSAMAPNTTWTVRVVVKVTAPAGTVITENAATMADTPDPNLANNMATVSTTVQ
jgi:hypothetical protein